MGDFAQSLIAESPPANAPDEGCCLGILGWDERAMEAHFLPLHRIRVVMFKRRGGGGGILPRLWALGNPSDSLVP